MRGRSEIRSHSGRLKQINIYLGKLFRIFVFEMDWKVLPMAAAIAVLVASVLGKAMFANMERLQSGAFAMVCVCIWNGFFNSIQVVCRERAIIKREHRAGLHISAYIAAHMIYQSVICFLQVIISLSVYLIYGVRFPSQGMVTGIFVLDLGLTLWIITFAADMMALMVSCVVRNTTTAMTVMPFLLIVQLVFAGVIFKMDTGVTGIISRMTLSRWGTNAICSVADYNGLPSQSLFGALYKFRSVPQIRDLTDYIQRSDWRIKLDVLSSQAMHNAEYSSDITNIMACWGMLLLIGAVSVLLGIIALEFVDRDRR